MHSSHNTIEQHFAAKMPTGLIQAKYPKPGSHQHQQLQDLDDDFALPQIPKEELDRLTLQEDLSEADRVKLLLSRNDQPQQQSYVFANALNIFRGNSDGIQQQIIPLIIKGLSGYNEGRQVEAGQSFKELLEQDVLDQSFNLELLRAAQNMLKLWSNQILHEWSLVYTLLIERLCRIPDKRDQYSLECVELAITLSLSHQPQAEREISAQIFSQIAQKSLTFSQLFIEKIIPRIHDLGRDPAWQIRLSIGRELCHYSKFIGQEQAQHLLYPILKRIVDDAEVQVKSKGINQILKHVTHKLFAKDFIEGLEFCSLVKKVLRIVASQDLPVSSRNSLLKHFPAFLLDLDPGTFGNDGDIDDLLLQVFNSARNTEQGRSLLPKVLVALSRGLYKDSNKFTLFFYPKFLQDFLNSELSSAHGTKIETKMAICGSLCSMILAALENEDIALDLVSKYKTLLDLQIRNLTNELVSSAIDLFHHLKSHHTVSYRIMAAIQETIKIPLLIQVESILIQNWRYHLNYFEKFLSQYLVLCDKEEATLNVFPIFLSALCSPNTSQPVKRFISEFFTEVIQTQANQYLRMAIQDSFTNDLAKSASSQQRQVFVYFLEQLLPKISKSYFKQVFMESYFNLSKDSVTSIILGYLKLVPSVRQKLEDIRSIERLYGTLLHIEKTYGQGGTHRATKDVREALLSVNSALKDQEFMKQVQIYQSTHDRQIAEAEHKLREIERADKNTTPQKKLEMTARVRMVREEAVSGIKSPQLSQSSQGSLQRLAQAPTLASKKEETKHIIPKRRNCSNNEMLKVVPFKVPSQNDKNPGAKTPLIQTQKRH